MKSNITAFRQARESDKYAELLCDVSEDLECAICQSIMFVPFVVDCGHSYCYCCLKSWFQHNNSCPECRAKICKTPSISLTLKSIAVRITDKIGQEDSRLKEMFYGLRTEQLTVYEDDLDEDNVFPHFRSDKSKSRMLDEDDGVRRCTRCHWELEEGESQCNNCGVWLSDNEEDIGEPINVDDDDGESDGWESRRAGRNNEEISDYEDDGFVVNDEEDDEEDNGEEEIDGEVSFMSDGSAQGHISSTRATTSSKRAILIDDSDLDSEDEKIIPKNKRTRNTIIDLEDDLEDDLENVHEDDSVEEVVMKPRSNRGSKGANKSRIRRRYNVPEESDNTSDSEESSGSETSSAEETDDEMTTDGVYTGISSNRRSRFVDDESMDESSDEESGTGDEGSVDDLENDEDELEERSFEEDYSDEY